jgi:hypothetical protein
MSHAKEIKVKSVPIVLDKPRTLKFDLNAFIELEDLYGSIEAALEAMQSGKNQIKAIRAVLWAGLLHEEETLTPKQVGTMIDLDKLEEVTHALMEAIEGAMPPKDSVQPQGASKGNPQ